MQQHTNPIDAPAGQTGLIPGTPSVPEDAPRRAGRRRRAGRQPTYGLKSADHERARAAIQRLLGIRVHHRAGVRKLCRIIAGHRGGAVPMDRLEQVRMVQRFVGAAVPAPEPLHDCSLPMPPLKPPGVAMRDAARRAREYHARPGWFELYGRCGLPRAGTPLAPLEHEPVAEGAPAEAAEAA